MTRTLTVLFIVIPMNCGSLKGENGPQYVYPGNTVDGNGVNLPSSRTR